MQYIVTGKIAPYAGNRRIVGKETYLSELAGGRTSPRSMVSGHYYVWSGNRAAHFDEWTDALQAAMSATGPLWRMPEPDSVVIVAID